MPTYEYQCNKCNALFEKFQSMTEAPVKTCPKCKSRKVARLIGTGSGFVFKGSGFYATDYRSEGYKKAREAESKKPSESKKTADSKKSTDSKSKKKGTS